ncbi:MAG: hypothetical protein WKF57_17800 [Nakamurella sp.]
MQIPKAIQDGVRDGRVTLAFRRWDLPRVRVGGTQLTPVGLVRFDTVDRVDDPAVLTEDDATAAGIKDLAELQRRLEPRDEAAPRSPRGSAGGAHIYRIGLSLAGEDPRVALRQKIPRGAALAELQRAVAALDAGKRTGPWTQQILLWIRDNPGVVSTELAALLQRELLPMKADIRKLKALGLTESLTVGYRLSPRGESYLRRL